MPVSSGVWHRRIGMCHSELAGFHVAASGPSLSDCGHMQFQDGILQCGCRPGCIHCSWQFDRAQDFGGALLSVDGLSLFCSLLISFLPLIVRRLRSTLIVKSLVSNPGTSARTVRAPSVSSTSR